MHSHSQLNNKSLNIFKAESWKNNVFLNNFINMLIFNFTRILSVLVLLNWLRIWLGNPKICWADIWRISLTTIFWGWLWSRWRSSLCFLISWTVQLLYKIFVLRRLLLSHNWYNWISLLLKLLKLLLILILLLNDFLMILD